MNKNNDFAINSEDQVFKALEMIQNNNLRVVVVLTDDGSLAGTVTDGDIRRALLRGISINDTVCKVMNREPLFIYEGDSVNEDVLNKCREIGVFIVPVVSHETSKVVGVEQIKELNVPLQRNNTVILMAGGLGSRLGDLTKECPKPMLSIGKEPILLNIINRLKEFGFYKFYFSVNYKSEMIEDYFGNGEKFGISISYLKEPKRMGTAGSLTLLPEEALQSSLLVMNADLMTKVNFGALLDFHADEQTDALMCIREYDFKIPYGVIQIEDDVIKGIEEKPTHSFFVNAGIYVLKPELLSMIPPKEYFDMPQLFNDLITKKMKTKVFPIGEYWLDIGDPEDYIKASGDYHENFNGKKND
jgi:dTDP-glucose pyrophosphorylase/predicted transcriptional regulator